MGLFYFEVLERIINKNKNIIFLLFKLNFKRMEILKITCPEHRDRYDNFLNSRKKLAADKRHYNCVLLQTNQNTLTSAAS